MRPHRRLIDLSTMEMLVMLRFNRDLCDKVVVDAAIKEAEPVKVATPSQPSQLIALSSSHPGPRIPKYMLLLMIVLNINIVKYYLNIFELLFFKILLSKNI